MAEGRWKVRWKRLLTVVALVAAGLGGGAWVLCASMPGSTHEGVLPPLEAEQGALAEELRQTVVELCSRGERNLEHPMGLQCALASIERRLGATGYPVRREAYAVAAREHDSINLVLDLPGTGLAHEIVVVGAHYDSVLGSPGANDNASGVAALCALAGRLARRPRERTLRFVAFANEEPPYYHTDTMGSLVHARAALERGDDVVGMLSLETLGCYSDAPGSQRYPIELLACIYPDRGDFVAFVGDFGARSLVRRCVGTFREHTRFPSEGAALPTWIPGVDWSDHWAFRRCGWPALMVTDTALFRYGPYHAASDTPEKLDYERLARVVVGLECVLAELVARVE